MKRLLILATLLGALVSPVQAKFGVDTFPGGLYVYSFSDSIANGDSTIVTVPVIAGDTLRVRGMVVGMNGEWVENGALDVSGILFGKIRHRGARGEALEKLMETESTSGGLMFLASMAYNHATAGGTPFVLGSEVLQVKDVSWVELFCEHDDHSTKDTKAFYTVTWFLDPKEYTKTDWVAAAAAL